MKLEKKQKLEVEGNIAKKRATFETWKLSYSKFIKNHTFWWDQKGLNCKSFACKSSHFTH